MYSPQATDSGLECPGCSEEGRGLWLYTLLATYVEDDHPTMEIAARCAVCHKTEKFEVSRWDGSLKECKEGHSRLRRMMLRSGGAR